MNQKGSLFPSVLLDVDLAAEFWLTLSRSSCSHNKNDAMFEVSLLFRYAAEVKNRILWMWDGNPILMLFSDGGSDHRLTYEHVKLSLIALFKELELDLLIAACTAPGHGWANSVERTIKLFLRKMKNRATLFLNPFDTTLVKFIFLDLSQIMTSLWHLWLKLPKLQ